jgi:DNA repair protein RadC
MTRRISAGVEILGVGLLDHVIAGSEGGDHERYFSFRERGLL